MIYLTNRFHVAMRLFSNRSQLTSKCGKNKEVEHELQASVLLMFDVIVIYYLLRPVLKELHWLPVEQRITFKVLLLTFKALNNLAPPYLSQLIVPYNPTRNLRSASKHLLEVPNVRLKSYGDRAFSVAAPKHWNDIPLDIKLSGSVDVFKSRLKTYLFRLAFD